jgi:hypothetical protein
MIKDQNGRILGIKGFRTYMEYQQVEEISQTARTLDTEGQRSCLDAKGTIHPLVRLQRMIGNRGVQRLIQAKFATRSSENMDKSEANRVPKKMASAPSELVIHRQCACGGATGPDGECDECREKRIIDQRARELSHVVQRQESPSQPAVPDHVEDETKATSSKSKPVLPIPVFDQVDPVVSVPSVPGVPDFLKGASLKLTDVKKALDAVRGIKEKPSNICGPPFIGFQTASYPPYKGLCCKGSDRSPKSCCTWREIALIDNRCCTGLEVVVQERCLPLKLAPLPPLPPPPSPEFNDLPGITQPPGTAVA